MFWLIAVSFVWAVSFGLIGNTLAGLPPSFVSAVRLGLSLLVFLPFTRKIPIRQAITLAAVGAVQFGLMYVSYIKSFQYVKSYEVAVFTIFTPLYVTLANDLMRKKFSGFSLFLASVSVLGAGIVLWNGWNSEGSVWRGFLMVQFSNVCFAVGQLAYARYKAPFAGHAEYRVFGWMYLGAFAAVLPFASDGLMAGLAAASPEQWWCLVYLGIVASGISFFLWNHGARQVAPTTLAVMNNLKIPLAAVCSIGLFGEKASLPTLLAGGALLAASILASWKRKGAG